MGSIKLFLAFFSSPERIIDVVKLIDRSGSVFCDFVSEPEETLHKEIPPWIIIAQPAAMDATRAKAIF